MWHHISALEYNLLVVSVLSTIKSNKSICTINFPSLQFSTKHEFCREFTESLCNISSIVSVSLLWGDEAISTSIWPKRESCVSSPKQTLLSICQIKISNKFLRREIPCVNKQKSIYLSFLLTALSLELFIFLTNCQNEQTNRKTWKKNTAVGNNVK